MAANWRHACYPEDHDASRVKLKFFDRNEPWCSPTAVRSNPREVFPLGGHAICPALPACRTRADPVGVMDLEDMRSQSARWHDRIIGKDVGSNLTTQLPITCDIYLCRAQTAGATESRIFLVAGIRPDILVIKLAPSASRRCPRKLYSRHHRPLRMLRGRYHDSIRRARSRCPRRLADSSLMTSMARERVQLSMARQRVQLWRAMVPESEWSLQRQLKKQQMRAGCLRAGHSASRPDPQGRTHRCWLARGRR